MKGSEVVVEVEIGLSWVSLSDSGFLEWVDE